MLQPSPDELEKRQAIVRRITTDLLAYYPKALILFGSTARYAAGVDTEVLPDDIDLLMVGGNIPGETRVISIAIYEQVETLNYAQAHILSAGLLAFSFLVLLSVYIANRRIPVRAF